MASKTMTRATIAIACAAALGACARFGIQPPPEPGDVVRLPSEMILMPVADAREDPYTHGDVRRYVKEMTGDVLGKKGYVVLAHDVIGGGARPPLGGIADMTASELAQLGPDGSRWLLFVSINRIASGYDAGGEELQVFLSGLVVDKADGTVLWQSAGSGRASRRGGFLRLIPPTPPEYNAVYDAVKTLFDYVPRAETS